MVFQNDVDLLNPSTELEKKNISPNVSFNLQTPRSISNLLLMDVKCQGYFNITTMFSHSHISMACEKY
ncbi:hypothetical protein LWI28_014933 [Acer negundo]|uniref:Uncharacterized protein n=1 Tax=Acer negundo TaxID=4023 RepID=A0AAD5NY47_ACENE|nr:hypothetical protein LWI28_014933 [Acer negundo]